jgi:hypothetical protein
MIRLTQKEIDRIKQLKEVYKLPLGAIAERTGYKKSFVEKVAAGKVEAKA